MFHMECQAFVRDIFMTMHADLPKPATYARMSKNGFHCQLTAPLINWLIATTPLWLIYGLLFLRFVSEACKISMSPQMSFECHWLACTGSHLAGNHLPTCSWIYLYFVTFWVQWDRPLHLENYWALLSCATLWLPTTHHLCINACSADKKLSIMVGKSARSVL